MILSLNDLLEVGFVCQATPQFSINVRHYTVTEVNGASVSDVAAADKLEDVFAPLYKAVLSASAKWWGLKLQVIKPVKMAHVINIDNRDFGDVAGDMLPRQTAAVIKMHTGVAGRSNRGRVYIPFPSESSNGANGGPSPGYVVDLQTLGDEFRNEQTVGLLGDTAKLTPVVYSRTAETIRLILAGPARSEWGTQRRRSNIGRPDADPLAS